MKTPRPVLERSDTHEIREKILNLSRSQAGRLGLGKSTVHYLKKRVRDRKAFMVYKPVLVKLKN